MANAELAHEHAIIKASNEHAVHIKQLQDQLEVAQGQMQQDKEQAESQLAASKAKVAEVEMLLATAQDNADNAIKQEQLLTLTTKLDEAEAKHAAAVAAQAELAKTNATHAAQHVQMETDHASLKQNVDNLQGELVAVRNELAMANEACVEREAQLQAAQAQVSSLESNVATRDAAYNRIKELKQETDRQLAELQNQLDVASANSESTIAELKQQLTQATTNAENAQQTQKGVDSALERYKLEVETLKQEQARSKVSCHHCSGQRHFFTFGWLQSNVELAQMNVEELNDEVDELKASLANVTKAHETLKQTVSLMWIAMLQGICSPSFANAR